MKPYIWIFASIIGAWACFYFGQWAHDKADETQKGNHWNAAHEKVTGIPQTKFDPEPEKPRSQFGTDPRKQLKTDEGKAIVQVLDEGRREATGLRFAGSALRFCGFGFLCALLFLEGQGFLAAIMAFRNAVPKEEVANVQRTAAQ